MEENCYLDCCRLCLSYQNVEDRVGIDETTKSAFESTFCFELKISKHYSSYVCTNCLEKLKSCKEIKSNFIKNQNFLYQQNNEESCISEHFEFEEIIEFEDNKIRSFETAKDESEELEEYFLEKLISENIEVDSKTITPTDNKLTQCDECGKSYKLKRNLLNHFKTHSSIIPKQQMITDLRNENPVNSKRVRKKTFKLQESENQQHKKSKDYLKKRVICPTCGIQLSKSSLKGHIDRVHLKIKRFQCDICSKSFYLKKHLKQHLKGHFGIRDVSCDLCSAKFASRDRLSTHKKQFHEKKYVRYCDICGLSFRSKTYFETHLRSKHTGERPFACDIEGCVKRFFSRYEFTAHKKNVHSDPVQCQVCFKMVSSMHTLKAHIKNHQEKPFVCNIVTNDQNCNKRYATAYLLKEHVNITHLGIKKYQCPFVNCQLPYASNFDLQSHIRNIHQLRKIKCAYCKALIGSKEYYRRHIMAHHPELSVSEKDTIITKIRMTKEDDLFNYQK